MSLFCPLVSLFVILITLSFAPNALQARNHSAFFIFGDSTVDQGNNNYVNTTPEHKANYPPYGRKGIQPTGRFSDGRIFVDFIAEYAGLPVIPDMLGPPSIKEYRYGVNFGSGDAGLLSGTNQDQGVIDLNTQLNYFEEVETKLKKRLGDDKANEIISNAVYFFSIGSNDCLFYLTNPEMQELYPERLEYLFMLHDKVHEAMDILYNKGARKFGFLSLPPLGCLPFMRAQNQGKCSAGANEISQSHNNFLKIGLGNIDDDIFADFKYSYTDFYKFLIDRMANPSAYGFKEGMKACCGTGPFNGVYSCGGKKNVTPVYEVCDNGDDYVFWDSFHPTEKLHEQIARALWDGPGDPQWPLSLRLRDLFNDYNNTGVNIAEA